MTQDLDFPTIPSYATNLNEAQWDAVSTIDGPLLVLAGAGTGKTRVLTTRIGHIIESGMAYPSQVLAVTFTNKAANEMRTRIQDLFDRSENQYTSSGMWVGTFHSLAVRVLRHHAELVGLESNFTILDSDDQLRLVKQIIRARKLDEKKIVPKAVAATISRWKDQGLTPAEAARGTTSADIFLSLYEEYEERLATLKAVDFGGLILHNLTIFKNYSHVLEDYHQKFRYILVDEYQDTNTAQYLWLRFLAQNNICCVGDDDQSIYGWRGAELQHILDFDRDFPNAKVVRLEQNYRSKGHILAAASGLISHNTGRLGKTLWTSSENGEKVFIRGTWNSDAESRFISDKIETLASHGESLSSVAILVRASFQTREFEERFLRIGLPYRVIGGLRFYERQEIRDAMAYIRVVVQPDDSLAFERIVNTPKRGIGNVTIQALHQTARENNTSLLQAAHVYIQNNSNRTAATLAALLEQIAGWNRNLESEDHVELTQRILEESGYMDFWRKETSPEAAGRLENLKELMSAIEEFHTLPAFLEHVSLVMDQTTDADSPMVTIMTLHTAKGLEFSTVFLPGWEEGLFPHNRSLQESGEVGLEEERRLAYVGISRARERSIITYTLQRRTYQSWVPSTPSRFVLEIPQACCTHILPNGMEAPQRQLDELHLDKLKWAV